MPFIEVNTTEIVSYIINKIKIKYPTYQSVRINKEKIFQLAYGLEDKNGVYRTSNSAQDFHNFKCYWEGGRVIEHEKYFEMTNIMSPYVNSTLRRYRPSQEVENIFDEIINEIGGMDACFEMITEYDNSYASPIMVEFNAIMGDIDDFIKRMPRRFPRYEGNDVIYDYLNDDFREDLRNYLKRQTAK